MSILVVLSAVKIQQIAESQFTDILKIGFLTVKIKCKSICFSNIPINKTGQNQEPVGGEPVALFRCKLYPIYTPASTSLDL